MFKDEVEEVASFSSQKVMLIFRNLNNFKETIKEKVGTLVRKERILELILDGKHFIA